MRVGAGRNCARKIILTTSFLSVHAVQILLPSPLTAEDRLLLLHDALVFLYNVCYYVLCILLNYYETPPSRWVLLVHGSRTYDNNARSHTVQTITIITIISIKSFCFRSDNEQKSLSCHPAQGESAFDFTRVHENVGMLL